MVMKSRLKAFSQHRPACAATVTSRLRALLRADR